MIKTIICNFTFIFLKILSKPLKKDIVEEQYNRNRVLWEKSAREGYIDNQAKMSGYSYGTASGIIKKLFFKGREVNASDNACEVIATYNAIVATDNMKEHYQFPELLKRFSRDGIVLKGAFGTNPYKIRSLLMEDYNIGELKGNDIKKSKVCRMSGLFDAFIFCTYNKGYNPFSMLHTMCIEKTVSGSYKIHNDYEGNKTYSSLYNAVTGYNSGKGGTVYILGLKKR